MEYRLLFSPESMEKKNSSGNSFYTNKKLSAPQKSSSRLKNEILTNLRKKLPQTSNLILKSRTPRKNESRPIMLSEPSQKKINPQESLPLIKKIRDKISENLFKLLVKIWTKYGKCPVFPDNSVSESGMYNHLYDHSFNKISSSLNIKEKPEFLIISSRSQILENSNNSSYLEKASLSEAKTVNYINLYSSIIEKDDSRNDSSRKHHRSPLCKLKNNDFQQRKCKSPFPVTEKLNYTPSRDDSIHIFPHYKGRRLKEGAGGFKKPILLFEKNKSFQSLSPDRVTERAVKSPLQKSHLKEYMDIEELCLKYSLSQPELVTILSDYTYMKETCMKMIEKITEVYNIKPEILKCINLNILNQNLVEWEDFVRLHVVVILKRGNFSDLLSFVINFLHSHSSKTEENFLISRVFAKNYNLVEKIIKIKNVLRNENSKKNIMGHLQEIGLNIFDLRVMVNLILNNI